MALPTQYDRPATLDDAIRAAQQPGSIALAGGALMLTGVLLPYERVIDLQDVPELKTLDASPERLRAGGALMLAELFDTPGLPPALKRALTRSLSPNLRNNTSIGESLCAPSAPREWLTALLALGALVDHRPGAHSLQEPLEDFLTALWESDEPYRGVVVSVDIPLPGERGALGAAHVARTPADPPLVNAAVSVELGSDGLVNGALAAIAGASAEPVFVLELLNLVGARLDEDTITQVAKPIASVMQPVADYKGSADYRREMARVCVRRALLDCMGQMRN